MSVIAGSQPSPFALGAVILPIVMQTGSASHQASAMVDVMQPTPDMRICDPACGTGVFFLAA